LIHGRQNADQNIRLFALANVVRLQARKYFKVLVCSQAGIPDKQLLIALEPEAAALWCMKQPMGGSGSAFAPESKYLVFDAGGNHMFYSVLCLM